MANVHFFLVLVLALLLVPSGTAAFDYFNILSSSSSNSDSHDDGSQLVQPAANISELIQAGQGDPLSRLGQPPYDPFDYLRLVTRWAPSHCKLRNSPCAVVPDFFTLHGLWPDNYAGNLLSYCYDHKYEPITDQNVLSEMTVVWPNVEDGNDQGLWKQQWEKHGTCSLFLYVNQRGYFYNALQIYSQFDVIGAIRESIPPNPTDDSYKRSQFIDTIRALTSRIPDLSCLTDKSGKQTLHEVHICFSWIRVPIDCPPNRIPTASRCTAETIYFPLK